LGWGVGGGVRLDDQERLDGLIEDARRHPFTGIGRAEPPEDKDRWTFDR
jgi:Txe/YoeB family toxin of Txe-Axe toxin-antitoxin module